METDFKQNQVEAWLKKAVDDAICAYSWITGMKKITVKFEVIGEETVCRWELSKETNKL